MSPLIRCYFEKAAVPPRPTPSHSSPSLQGAISWGRACEVTVARAGSGSGASLRSKCLGLIEGRCSWFGFHNEPLQGWWGFVVRLSATNSPEFIFKPMPNQQQDNCYYLFPLREICSPNGVTPPHSRAADKTWFFQVPLCHLCTSGLLKQY